MEEKQYIIKMNGVECDLVKYYIDCNYDINKMIKKISKKTGTDKDIVATICKDFCASKYKYL